MGSKSANMPPLPSKPCRRLLVFTLAWTCLCFVFFRVYYNQGLDPGAIISPGSNLSPDSSLNTRELLQVSKQTKEIIHMILVPTLESSVQPSQVHWLNRYVIKKFISQNPSASSSCLQFSNFLLTDCLNFFVVSSISMTTLRLRVSWSTWIFCCLVSQSDFRFLRILDSIS